MPGECPNHAPIPAVCLIMIARPRRPKEHDGQCEDDCHPAAVSQQPNNSHLEIAPIKREQEPGQRKRAEWCSDLMAHRIEYLEIRGREPVPMSVIDGYQR